MQSNILDLIDRVVVYNPRGGEAITAKRRMRRPYSNADLRMQVRQIVKVEGATDSLVKELIENHPDKHLFDNYYEDKKKQKDDENLNCGGCAAAASMLLAEGETSTKDDTNIIKENLKFSKYLLVGSLAVVGLAVLISISKK